MLLSIIIPAYNAEKFIGSILDTLIKQGLSDTEVIVVDDGSTDNTKVIVEEFVSNNSKIKIISQKNKGVSVARNGGIDNAQGDFVFFLDSDDCLTEGTLDYFRNVLKNHPENVFFGFGYYSTYKGRRKKDYSQKRFNGKVLNSLTLKRQYLSKKIEFHVCSCICNNEFLKSNLIYFSPKLKIGEDSQWLFNIFQYAPNCVYHSRNCFIYQTRDDSVMQGLKSYNLLQYNSYKLSRDLFFSEQYQNDKLKKYANFWVLNRLLSNIITYIRSSYKKPEITKSLQDECKYFKLPIVNGQWKNTLYIYSKSIASKINT